MVDCPNCNHSNPEGAEQCEACFTPLSPAPSAAGVPPTVTPNHSTGVTGENSNGIPCPKCGSTIQPEATFCGECGERFAAQTPGKKVKPKQVIVPPTLVIKQNEGDNNPPSSAGTDPLEVEPIPDLDPIPDPAPIANVEEEFLGGQPDPKSPALEEEESPPPSVSPSPSLVAPIMGQGQATQLQLQSAKLLHVQTDNIIDLPQGLNLIHVGKPNDVIPPDIDVSGFSNSDIVSRCHANIRVEGDNYFLEDVGSSNGTYVNNLPLPTGNRHKLRVGDRFSLGKGDKVTFIFQIA